MHVLIHSPTEGLAAGERTFIARETIDLALARQQHADYAAALVASGAEVHRLDINCHFSDAVFIEDTALILDEVAILGWPAVPSRQGEVVGMEPVLRRWREVVRTEPPATLEGGDVLRVGRQLWVGHSRRTNRAGIELLMEWGRRLGYAVTPVLVRKCLHLKTACTALPDGRFLIHRPWVDAAALGLGEERLIDVPPEEPWGANVLTVGNRVLVSASCPRTIDKLTELGYCTQGVELSEFLKAEGGPTCLSLFIP